MNNKLLDLTIVIPAKNEEKNLQGCIDAIGVDFAKKIILIDSESTDKTIDIAKENEIDVISFKWNGQFPKKRNWYLRNHPPATEWVLFLDADEYLTPAFKTEVRRKIGVATDVVGFWLSYSIYFMGKRLKGGYPLKKLALFKVGTGEYERIEECHWSHLDMEIHEHPILNGNVGQIKHKIDHRDFRGLEHYIHKHNEYSSWEAFRYMQMKKAGDAGKKLTFKQKIKYKLFETPLIGAFYFIGSFVFLGGFKDGIVGYLFASFKKNYFLQIYSKIKEIKNR